MKNTTLLLVTGGMIILAGFFLLSSPGKAANGEEPTPTIGNDVQRITLSERNFNYYPETVTVKAGKPVEIRLDTKVQGCLRALRFPQLGVSKYLKSATDTLVFTPTQKGTYKYSCSMGMGFGTLVVE